MFGPFRPADEDLIGATDRTASSSPARSPTDRAWWHPPPNRPPPMDSRRPGRCGCSARARARCYCRPDHGSGRRRSTCPDWRRGCCQIGWRSGCSPCRTPFRSCPRTTSPRAPSARFRRNRSPAPRRPGSGRSSATRGTSVTRSSYRTPSRRRGSSTRRPRTTGRTPGLWRGSPPPGGRSPTGPPLCPRGQGAADDVCVGRILNADAERGVDPRGRVVIDLAAWRERLECRRGPGGGERHAHRRDHRDSKPSPPSRSIAGSSDRQRRAIPIPIARPAPRRISRATVSLPRLRQR